MHPHLPLPRYRRTTRRTTRTVIRALLPMLLFVPTPGNSQLTIEHCQGRARANHPMVVQYGLIDKSTEYTIANANKAYLPQVSITGLGAYIFSELPVLPGSTSASNDHTKAIGIGRLEQVIWDGGATGAHKDVIAAGAEVEKANLDVSLHQLRERVDQLFFGILVTDAQLAQLDIATASLQRNLDKLALSQEEGLALRSDVDEVRAELLLLGQRRIEFTHVRSGYVDMLSLLIGEPLEPSVALQRPAVSASVTAAQGQRPELRLFEHQRTLATAQRDLERTALMPKVGLMGAGMLLTPTMDMGLFKMSSLALAGISLSWNTAGLYRNGNNRKLHELRLQRIASQESTFLFNNALELRKDDAEIEKARAILAADEEIVALKKRIKEAYQLKYDNGLCSMSDLINAINKESEAESNKALHEVLLALSLQRYATQNGN